jgi:hypothetical protein
MRMLQGDGVQAHISTPMLKVMSIAVQPQIRRYCNNHEAQEILVLQMRQGNLLQGPWRSSLCRSPIRIRIHMI